MVTRIWAILDLGLDLSKTLSSFIELLIIVINSVSLDSKCFTNSSTDVPSGPRIIFIASIRLYPSKDSPFTSMIISPGRIPASFAGLPSKGDTITTSPFAFISTLAPIPWYFPCISVFSTLKNSGLI